MDYGLLKLVHQTSVVLSISGFVLRGSLMLAGSGLLRRRWMRTWPHFIDTTLLVSGIWMAVIVQLHPGNSPWLGAKLAALLAYIVLGAIALRGSTRRRRILALCAAVICFAYMVLVALRRSVIPL